MISKEKVLAAGGVIMVCFFATGIVATSASGDMENLNKVHDVAGIFPIPIVTSASAASALTFEIANDEIRKHYPKAGCPENWAVLSIN